MSRAVGTPGVMWHRVAPELASHFTLVIADLPGYGWSAVPEADADHAPYTKRAMAAVMVEAMEALGFVRFRLAGHDRGGRVGYRLALDHPGRLEQLAVLDIITTWDMWHRFDARLASRAWHWTFLALPEPFPETLIGHDPAFFFDSRARAGAKPHPTLPRKRGRVGWGRSSIRARWRTTTPPTRTGSASTPCARTIAPAAPPISPTTKPTVPPAIRSAARCWRCGALAACPPMPASIRSLAWRDWAPDLRGFAIESGHYVPEENPAATARALLEFFSAR